MLLRACGAALCGGSRPSGSVSSGFEEMDHAEGPPHASWLRQVESYLRDMDMTDPAFAWDIASRKTREYRRRWMRRRAAAACVPT